MIFAKQTYKKDICHVYGDYLPRIRKIFATLGRRSNTTLRILSVKGEGVVPPKSVTPFLLKTLSVKGARGVPPKSVTFFLAEILSVKGGGYPPYGQNPQSST